MNSVYRCVCTRHEGNCYVMIGAPVPSQLAETQSLVTSFQASDTQKMNCCFDGLLMFPNFVFAWFSDSIQLWYLFRKATLNASLTAASKGWKSAVLPAGTNICVTFFFLSWSAADLTRCTDTWSRRRNTRMQANLGHTMPNGLIVDSDFKENYRTWWNRKGAQVTENFKLYH